MIVVATSDVLKADNSAVSLQPPVGPTRAVRIASKTSEVARAHRSGSGAEWLGGHTVALRRADILVFPSSPSSRSAERSGAAASGLGGLSAQAGGPRAGGSEAQARREEAVDASPSTPTSNAACVPDTPAPVGCGGTGRAAASSRLAEGRTSPAALLLASRPVASATRPARLRRQAPQCKETEPARDDAYLLYARSEAGDGRRRRWSAAGSAPRKVGGDPKLERGGLHAVQQGRSRRARQECSSCPARRERP